MNKNLESNLVYLLKNGKIVLDNEIITCDLLIRNGYIEFPGNIRQSIENLISVDCTECWILPGFRDQHIHDKIGIDEQYDKANRFIELGEVLAQYGVTSYYISTFAAEPGRILEYANTAKYFIDSAENGKNGAVLSGVNLEGTYINPKNRGAQPPEYILTPNSTEYYSFLDDLIEIGSLKLINIVPDFGESSTTLIKRATDQGVIVGCGHTQGTAKQLEEAIKAGTAYFVHFANGPISQTWKPFHDGGAFEGGLRLPIAIELIADFYHIAPWYLSDFIQRRLILHRTDEIILVTDALFPIIQELPVDEFLIGSNLGIVSPDKKILFSKGHFENSQLIPAPPNTLCSSLLNMKDAFTNILNLLTIDYQGMMIDAPAKSLEAALLLLSKFCATNQAKLVHLNEKTGRLAPAKDADLVVLKIEGSPGAYKTKILHTFVKGRKVFG